jgi:hypothetical protein
VKLTKDQIEHLCDFAGVRYLKFRGEPKEKFCVPTDDLQYISLGDGIVYQYNQVDWVSMGAPFT